MAAGQDAADRNMKKDGRSAWNEEDCNLAADITARLLGRQSMPGLNGTYRSWRTGQTFGIETDITIAPPTPLEGMYWKDTDHWTFPHENERAVREWAAAYGLAEVPDVEMEAK